MITQEECIDTIKANTETIVQHFEVRSLRLFGSLARNEQRESSDVDVCVEMPPDIFLLIGLKQYLEELLDCNVDIIRIHRNMDDFLKNQIEQDGIYIIRETSPRVHKRDGSCVPLVASEQSSSAFVYFPRSKLVVCRKETRGLDGANLGFGRSRLAVMSERILRY